MMDMKKILDNKTILVTGGTGSFGHHVVERILAESSPKEVRIFSRDEKKQYDMRNLFKNDNISFIIGDVRDSRSINAAMGEVDYVFHAAALKQVPSCEFFPLEAVKTNILGATNVLDAAESAGVTKVVVLSTDKAVYPINAMGMTKALMEKQMIAKARSTRSDTVFCGVRYGNVMYSRGSVIPLFVDQIQRNLPLTITNPDMTRFLLPLPIAIDLVFFAMANGENGDMLVRKSPAATVDNMAQAIIDIFESDVGIKVIGTREGEKLHETLVTKEELMRAENHKDYYRIGNLGEMDYKRYFTEGINAPIPDEGYTSANTDRLTLEQTKNLMLSLREIRAAYSAMQTDKHSPIALDGKQDVAI